VKSLRLNLDRRFGKHAVARAYAALSTFRGDLQVSIMHDVIEDIASRNFHERECFEGRDRASASPFLSLPVSL